MRKYTFEDGSIITSNLCLREVIKRSKRLDTIRVLLEQVDNEIAQSIVIKALRAYNKTNNFTGIIRLTSLEKDFIASYLDDSVDYCLTDYEICVIKYYLKSNEN